MSRTRVYDNKKAVGRPATGIGTLVGVRMQPDQIELLDGWIAKQDDPKPSRPEAVRRILKAALSD
ncbi:MULTISPECIES: hypothetical protein [Qipengyuania]|uniref:hypothetical protein n=1 Tax=Qipengyuania TaxID=1855416 RepID=UPI001E31E4B0|nr:hypothetical protein [Qipengyuania citrea]MCD1589691.1 hypothetical protein [Qipengyuania citrea]